MPFSVRPVPDPRSAPDTLRNNWNVYDTDEVFTWESALPAGLPAEAILEWQAAVLTAGEEHSIMRVLAAPAWDYRRDRDGPVLDWLRRHGDRIEPMWPYPTAFLLGRTLHYEVAALVTYASKDGVVGGWFSDVAKLGAAAGLPPLRHAGDAPLTVETSSWDDGSFSASFGVATDLWFAWNEPWHRTGPERIDNRALASLNAPRLNAFLADVRAACLTIGGTWTWDTASELSGIRQVNKDGFVVLDQRRAVDDLAMDAVNEVREPPDSSCPASLS